MKHKGVKVTIIANFLLLGLIMGVLYAALNASAAHKWYFEMIHRQTGWVIEAKDIAINPFLMKVQLKSVSVQSRTGRQLYAVEGLHLQVSPWSLMRGKLVVSRLEIRDVYMSFEKGPKKEGPKKFTVPYIKKIASQVGNHYAMQNISINSGAIGPVRIMIKKRAGGYADLEIAKFDFTISQNLLRKNEFHFEALDFFINDKIVGDRIVLDSVLSGDHVVFDKLDLYRPEGHYDLYLDVEVRDEDIGGDIQVSAVMPNLFRKKIHGSGQVSLRPPDLFLSPFNLKVGDVAMVAPGKMYVPEGDYDVDFSMKASPLKAVWEILNIPAVEEIGGKAALNAELKARLPEFHLSADVDAKEVTYKYFRFPVAKAAVEVDGRHIEWKGHVPLGEGRPLTSQGSVDLEGKPQKLVLKELAVQLHGLPLQAVMPGGEAAGPAKGTLSLKRTEKGMHGAGTLSLHNGHIANAPIDVLETGFKVAWPMITADRVRLQLRDNPMLVTTRPLKIKYGEQKITVEGDPLPGVNLALDYDKTTKAWNLQKFRLQDDGRVVRASGFYRENKTFQLNLKGDVNAKHVARWRTFLNDAKGFINVDLRASGTTKRPQLSGNVRFNQTQLNVRGAGEPFTNVTGRVHITPTRIQFDRISAVHGEGDLKIHGTVGIDGIRPTRFNLDLQGNALTFRVRGAMNVDFDANLTVSGAMPSPLVSGRIDLLSGRYYKRFNLTKKVFAERQNIRTNDLFDSDFIKDWRWRVEVRNSGDLRIENNIATVFLDGNLWLKGSTQRPVIEGVVTSSGGELHYLGRTLEITEGSLDFRNPNRINPYLDFEAQREIQGAEGRGLRSYYTVFVKLEGPLDNLETKLWSSPSVERADVISLLAFGVRQSELSGSGASRRAFATTAIANSLTSGFGEDLGDIVGLDILRFESGEGSDQSISGVAFGKNLSDRLSVEFYTDISPDTAQRRVRTKYFLTDNIFLEGANTFESDRNKFELNVSLQFKIR